MYKTPFNLPVIFLMICYATGALGEMKLSQPDEAFSNAIRQREAEVKPGIKNSPKAKIAPDTMPLKNGNRICINDKICDANDFKTGPSNFRTDLFAAECRKLFIDGYDRSLEALSCFTYVSGFINALNMRSFSAVEDKKLPEFCISGSAEEWIAKFIQYTKDNPDLTEKRVDYSLFKFFNSRARCSPG